jgi:hypothetical protein
MQIINNGNTRSPLERGGVGLEAESLHPHWASQPWHLMVFSRLSYLVRRPNDNVEKDGFLQGRFCPTSKRHLFLISSTMR